jgi:hypothetical protein
MQKGCILTGQDFSMRARVKSRLGGGYTNGLRCLQLLGNDYFSANLSSFSLTLNFVKERSNIKNQKAEKANAAIAQLR